MVAEHSKGIGLQQQVVRGSVTQIVANGVIDRGRPRLEKCFDLRPHPLEVEQNDGHRRATRDTTKTRKLLLGHLAQFHEQCAPGFKKCGQLLWWPTWWNALPRRILHLDVNTVGMKE
jgi:hypothetical protein